MGSRTTAPPAEAPAESPEDLFRDGAVTVGKAVEFSGIGRTELYELMAAGAVPYTTHGTRRLIPRRALVRLLAARMAPADGRTA